MNTNKSIILNMAMWFFILSLVSLNIFCWTKLYHLNKDLEARKADIKKEVIYEKVYMPAEMYAKPTKPDTVINSKSYFLIRQ